MRCVWRRCEEMEREGGGKEGERGRGREREREGGKERGGRGNEGGRERGISEVRLEKV